LLTIVQIVLFSQAGHAHTDTPLEVLPDGSITGLPDKYGPAALRVVFSQVHSHRVLVSSLEVLIGRNKTSVPLCLTELLNARALKDITVLASWYHEEKYSPYYLALDFHDPGYKEVSWPRAGYSLVFNLRTAKLIGMSVQVVRPYGQIDDPLPLDVPALCSKADLNGVWDATAK
jgi:hypothetical protein